MPRGKRGCDPKKAAELFDLMEKFIDETGDYSYYIFAASILNEHEELAETLIGTRTAHGCKDSVSECFKSRMRTDHHRCKTKKIDAIKVYNAAVRAHNERNGTDFPEVFKYLIDIERKNL